MLVIDHVRLVDGFFIRRGVSEQVNRRAGGHAGADHRVFRAHQCAGGAFFKACQAPKVFPFFAGEGLEQGVLAVLIQQVEEVGPFVRGHGGYQLSQVLGGQELRDQRLGVGADIPEYLGALFRCQGPEKADAFLVIRIFLNKLREVGGIERGRRGLNLRFVTGGDRLKEGLIEFGVQV